MFLQSTVQEKGRKGRQKKKWEDNICIKEWTGGWTLFAQLGQLKTSVERDFCKVICSVPKTSQGYEIEQQIEKLRSKASC